VKRADDLDAVRDHLGRLQPSGSLWHAKQSRGATGHSGSERDGCIHEDLARLERALQVGQVLRLIAERDAQQDDRSLLDRLAVLQPGGRRTRQPLLQFVRRFRCAARVARADDHWRTGTRKTQSQPETEGSGAADDRYWLVGHGARIYPLSHACHPRRPLRGVNCATFPILSTGSFRSVEESVDEETQLVQIYGDVDLKTARSFRGALDEAAQDGKQRLIVDMSEVPFMDSSGLAALIGAQKAFREQTRLIVVCPDNLRRIFEVTRLDSIVSVVSSLPEALVA
jgi:anti-sigma B factor antagonist